MTLIEAIKSGKPFKRPSWREFLCAASRTEDFQWSSGIQAAPLLPFEILSEDWQIDDSHRTDILAPLQDIKNIVDKLIKEHKNGV